MARSSVWSDSDQALLHVLAFEATELSQQGDRCRFGNRQLGKAGFAQRDVERGESLFALDVQLGATIDKKLHDGVGGAVRRPVERGLATGVHLVQVEAGID